MKQLATNLICTLDLPVSTDMINDKVEEALCSEDNEYDEPRFRAWFLDAFGPFHQPGEEEEDAWADDDDADGPVAGKASTVPLPMTTRLGESWEIQPLRRRMQWHRIKGDVEGDRDLEKLYGLEDDDDEDPNAQGWCCYCWYEFWIWWKINRLRTKARRTPFQRHLTPL